MKKVIPILVFILLFTGCSTQKKVLPVTKTEFLLNTVSSITIYDMEESSAKAIIDECFKLSREYENKLSKTVETSEISQINNSKGQWVNISDDTIYLITMAKKYSQLSDGKFDCTIAPVTELWDFTSENPSVPVKKDLEEAVKHVNWKNIEIDGNNIRLTDNESSIDLGGIAKGYIGDKAKEFLVDKGVEKAIVNFGGNILTINSNSEDSFRIGIQKPFDIKNDVFGVLKINNKSVVTSGNYERYFIEDGKLYHHILDTKTGMPIDNGLSSVTIITDNSTNADALSTTCFVMGLKEGMKLIESLPDTEAVFINRNYEYFTTSGIGQTINFELIDGE